MKLLLLTSCFVLVVSSGKTSVLAQQPSDGQESTVSMPQPVRLLTSDERYDDGYPAVSPHGMKIVFARGPAGQSGKYRLWVMATDGGEAHPLSPENFPLSCTRTAWSPNGTTVAFRAGRDENAGGIWLISSDGSNLRRLTDEEKFDDMYPAWSPDGKWLVFSRGPITQEYTNDLWQVTLDGWQRQLTRGKDKWDVTNSVAPDGRRIAFASSRGNSDPHDLNVWIMTIQGGKAAPRPFTFGGGEGPAWSPDGAWIAFTSNRGGGHAVYLKRVNGGPVIRITEADNHWKGHPAWSHDGNWIVYELESKPRSTHLALVDVRTVVKRIK